MRRLAQLVVLLPLHGSSISHPVNAARKTRFVADTSHHVIVGVTGNALFILGRTFQEPEHKGGSLSEPPWRGFQK
jgi:hypothetical protein